MGADVVRSIPLRRAHLEVQSAAPPGKEQESLSEVIHRLGTRYHWTKLLMPFQKNLTSAAAERRRESREGEWQWNRVLPHLSNPIVKKGGKIKRQLS